MKTGFTLGKYAPFHDGHLYVLTTALKEMDHVIAVIYNASETTGIPTEVRAEWIRKSLPQVEVIVAEDGPQDTGYTRDIVERQNNYLKNLLGKKKIDAFYSSEPYGESVSAAFRCMNRIVDLERKHHPLSATEIRKNPLLLKNSVPSVVYETLKPKFYFLGAPSTGKTTLSELCVRHFNGMYCEEYGREYWFQFQKNHRLSMEDLEAIAVEHNAREEKAFISETPFTFIDTCNLTTMAYAHYYFGYASKVLENTFRRNLWKYSHVFLCDEDIPFSNTWDRSGPDSRGQLQKINRMLLKDYGINYTVVSGSISDRLKIIQEYMEYNNLWQIC
jgi:NadR type nicotinamide-nucleotide adenylyltransferase